MPQRTNEITSRLPLSLTTSLPYLTLLALPLLLLQPQHQCLLLTGHGLELRLLGHLHAAQQGMGRKAFQRTANRAIDRDILAHHTSPGGQ